MISRELSVEVKPSGVAAGLFGIVVFLGGVALLLFVFKLAYEMFMVDPKVLFGLKESEALELSKIVPTLLGVLVRIAMLMVMAIFGGMIANRGIRLYADAKGRTGPPAAKTE